MSKFTDRMNRISDNWDKPKWHDREPWMGIKVIAGFTAFGMYLFLILAFITWGSK